MTCLCPKCGAPNDLEYSEVPAQGLTTNCLACNTRLQIVRESFARMAYGASSGKSCASCGGQLGPGLSCPACGTLYPDFFQAMDPAVLRQKARELKRQQILGAFTSVEFSFPDFKTSGRVKSRQHININTVSKDSGFSSLVKSDKFLKTLSMTVITVAVIAAGYLYFAQKKAEQLYVDKYFKALYAIKAGSDISKGVTLRVSSDWKTAQDAGRSFSPLPSTEELNALNKVNSKVEIMLLKELALPPKKFVKSQEGLLNLKEQYSKLHSLAISPPNSLTELKKVSVKTFAAFDESAKELKPVLADVMSAELVSAKKKYKNLSDF